MRYYAQRPQVQERMTVQILVALQEALDTEDVVVIVEGKHLCVSARGIQDDASSTTTSASWRDFLKVRKRKRVFTMYQGLIQKSPPIIVCKMWELIKNDGLCLDSHSRITAKG